MPVLFLGCEGDDGSAGPAGPIGPPGPGLQANETCTVCHDTGRIADIDEEHALEQFATVTIANVTVASPPVMNFTVAFPAGSTADPAALANANFFFTIARLEPAAPGSGDSDSWQSYINTTTNGQIHATRENNGTLVNNGGGSYTYTFATDIANVTTPVAVPFDNTLVHRAGIELRGSIPRGDAVFTFIPDTGATVPTAREIVDLASCNECHQKLALHSNRRFSTELCVLCHNPGSTDPTTGNTLDFKVMIHKIHRGEELPSVQNGIPYVEFDDFSNVVFPAGPTIPELRNCTKCHNNAVAVDADNWIDVPTREACGACHDDIDFDTGGNLFGGDLHGGGAQPNNAGCANVFCHGSAILNPQAVHTIPQVEEAKKFQFIIDNVTNTGPGEFPVVTFSVKNPIDNTFYDILTDPAFTTPGTARLAIDIGWDTRDHNNTGSGSPPAQPISINPVDNAITVDNDDGTFTTTSSRAIYVDATGTGVVAIEGHPAADDPETAGSAFDLRVPVKGAIAYVPITDTSAVPRRQVVDIDKCNQCHIALSLHGNNRTDEPRLCVICHNPDATDINRRPADPATTPDGKKEESIDFKRMIHAIHAGEASEHGFRDEGYVVFGFSGNANDYSEVRFPGILNNCEGCHLAGTYGLPLGANVLDTTVDTGADLSIPGDDLNVTKTAAVCTACHDDALVADHVVLGGGDFGFVAP